MHPLDYLINKDEALRYLGWQKELPEENAALYDKAEELFLAAAQPKYYYQVFDKNELGFLLTGNDIAAHLANSEKIVLLAATLGSAVDMLIRRSQIEDMALSVIIDALASAAIEEVCDAAAESVHKEYPHLRQTSRYSPGYGDWDLSMQKEFLRTLNAGKKIGLCLNSSLLLTPLKSVTAAIGLENKDAPRIIKKKDCTACNLFASCAYRKGGTTCGH